MFNKIWDSRSDIIPLILIVFLTFIIGFYEPLWLPLCIMLIGIVYYYNKKSLRSKKCALTAIWIRWCAISSVPITMRCRIWISAWRFLPKMAGLQWKNELFSKYIGTKNVEGKRPEEVLPLQPNAFDTLSVKDGERLIQIEDRYYNMKHCKVQTSEKARKKARA